MLPHRIQSSAWPSFLHLCISLPTKVLLDQLNVHRNDSAGSSIGFKGLPVFLFTPLITSDFCHKKDILQVATAFPAQVPDQGQVQTKTSNLSRDQNLRCKKVTVCKSGREENWFLTRNQIFQYLTWNFLPQDLELKGKKKILLLYKSFYVVLLWQPQPTNTYIPSMAFNTFQVC